MSSERERDYEAEYERTLKPMTAPAKRLEFGEPLSWKDNCGDAETIGIVGNIIHKDGKTVIASLVAPKYGKRLCTATNALAGLHIENGELRELLEVIESISDIYKNRPCDLNHYGAMIKLMEAYQKVTAPSQEATP